MKAINVYTDGAVSRNGKRNARGGIGIFFSENSPLNVSHPFLLKPITNQRAELFAIVQAISIVLSDSSLNHANTTLCIHTDSMYAFNIATKWIENWKSRGWVTSKGDVVKNKDIVEVLYEQLHNGELKLTFTHVKAHSDCYGNNMADKLAVAGRQ